MPYTVFILLCSDGAFHIGVAKQFNDRLEYHNSGKNPFTKNRLPVDLVYQKLVEDVRDALAIEAHLKTYNSQELVRIINGELDVELQPHFQKPKSETGDHTKSLILPAVYFGNLSYFEAISTCTLLLLDGEERYEKQTFRSRCTLLSANGLQNLVVPVIRPNGKNTAMKDVQISYTENWQKDHLKAIESAYRKSPFYDYYAPELIAIFNQKFEKLIELNAAITSLLIRLMGWDIQVEITSPDQTSSIEAKRLVHPKTCPTPTKTEYHQIFSKGKFEPNLSLLDYLFNEGNAW